MKQPAFLRRRTKIVATLGPAAGTAAVIERLIRAGLDIARLNLAHGTLEQHRRYAATVRRLSRRLGVPVSIIADIPGPKYRIGRLQGGQAVLKKGAILTLTTRDVIGDASRLPVDLPNLPQDVKPGDTVLLDDGAMRLRVLAEAGGDITCRVMVGGTVTERRGLVVPGVRGSAPFLTEALRNHIRFAATLKPDYIAVSFVSDAADIEAVREILRQENNEILLIAKIERVQAVRHFDAILAASDGVMVARGDLGVDIPLAKVPLIQKEIIAKCNRAGKPVITATQMLESMVGAARPTRAEVTDVANAIFDGTDATMLSAETSIGRYPVAAVRMMAQIARETERKLPYDHLLSERSEWIERETDELISYSACHTAAWLRAAAIVAFTHSGSTARRVAKYRPRVPILAITSDEAVSGRLRLHWGVYPFATGGAATLRELFASGAALTRQLGITRPGDLIVITGGVPIGIPGSTNLLKVEIINEVPPA